MTKQKKLFALLLAAALCFAMLFSALYISVEADHDCTGADCAICTCIRICENTLKALGTAVAVAGCTAAVGYTLLWVWEKYCSHAGNVTLISLKVKLSN